MQKIQMQPMMFMSLELSYFGQKMTFLTDAGVFSKKMIDFGSQLLLRCLDIEKVKNS